MRKVIALFPGQGSQKVGMGKDVYEAFASARATFQEAEEALGISLRRICFELSEEELRATNNAQIALLVHGAAMWAVLRENDADSALASAGHSVGEYAAFHSAGAISLPDVAKLVNTRGRAMGGAGVRRPGTMAAIIGELKEDIAGLCKIASKDESIVVPANYNAPEQIVISGSVDAVERAMQLATDAGARKVMRLNVSGAFHSPLMDDAQSELLDALEATAFSEPAVPVYTNVEAAPCSSAELARDLLGRQLVSPVRWVELTRAIERDFPEAICLELGPGSVLAGLVKRCAPSLRTLPFGSARDIDAISKVMA